MAIAEQIKTDLQGAMRAGEKEKVGALRLVLSELQKAAKEGSDDELAVLRRERKRRLEAAKAYRDAGRDDLAGGEESEDGQRQNRALVDQRYFLFHERRTNCSSLPREAGQSSLCDLPTCANRQADGSGCPLGRAVSGPPRPGGPSKGRPGEAGPIALPGEPMHFFHCFMQNFVGLAGLFWYIVALRCRSRTTWQVNWEQHRV